MRVQTGTRTRATPIQRAGGGRSVTAQARSTSACGDLAYAHIYSTRTQLSLSFVLVSAGLFLTKGSNGCKGQARKEARQVGVEAEVMVSHDAWRRLDECEEIPDTRCGMRGARCQMPDADATEKRDALHFKASTATPSAERPVSEKPDSDPTVPRCLHPLPLCHFASSHPSLSYAPEIRG